MCSLRSRLLSFLVAALLAILVSPAAGAQEAPPPSDRDRQLEERALALRGQATDVRAAVLRVRADVARQTERVAAAEADAALADQALSAATARRADARVAVKDKRAAVKRLAAASYIQGPANVSRVLEAKDINEAVRRRAMAQAAGDAGARTLAQLRRAEDETTRSEAAADEAAVAARSALTAARDEAQNLATEQARQQRLLEAVDERLERTLAEAAAVATVDASVPEAIATAEQPLRDAITAPIARPALRAVPKLPPVPTIRVQGITVASEIAPQLATLLDTANAAGVVLGGGGYRDSAVQVALRLEHCGPTDYDLYEKPAGECAPPTARPGASMHERGTAIDFAYAGSAITSVESPAFIWLAANAERFGLKNLPEEPWHWSTTGT